MTKKVSTWKTLIFWVFFLLCCHSSRANLQMVFLRVPTVLPARHICVYNCDADDGGILSLLLVFVYTWQECAGARAHACALGSVRC